MNCRSSKNVPGLGTVSCCYSDTNHPRLHRYQRADAGGTAIVVEWADQSRRVGFAELNGLDTLLSTVPLLPDAEVGLALAGWLNERPGVAEHVLANLDPRLRSRS